ncbi:MAG: hypothetical protein V8R75_13925 [Oscillospiraceae bacterium]
MTVVSVLELFFGLMLLRRRRDVRKLFAGHVISMALGFFLTRSLFANWLDIQYGIASISNSVNIGLFGLLWMVSVGFVVAMVGRLTREREA